MAKKWHGHNVRNRTPPKPKCLKFPGMLASDPPMRSYHGTKEATLILLLSREYISIFLEKNGPITVHFRSKKVGTLNCKRFRAGVAFRRVCKAIKIVGKVFVYERLLTNFVEKMLHKHSDWVPKNY